MSRNLLIHQSIRTTKTKAKAIKPQIERLITLGKIDNLSSHREAFSILQDHKLVRLLFTEISPRFSKRNGGYCRILPLGFRRGDGAELVILELTEKKKIEKRPKKKKETQPKPKEKVTEAVPETVPEAVEIKKPPRKFLGGLRKIFKKEDRGPR